MPRTIVFDDVSGISANTSSIDKSIVILPSEDSDTQIFNGTEWDITIILSRKPIAGWYVEKSDLENPDSGSKYGICTQLMYFTQAEIDEGEIPNEDMIRVQVVPYPES
jgi:hypothetical protein